MLLSYIMIVLGILIIGCIALPKEAMLKLWLKLGMSLFDYIMIHADDDTGDFYGFTFTDDKNWEDKCFKDLNKQSQNHRKVV